MQAVSGAGDPVTMKGFRRTFDERFHSWFSSLSPEARTRALSIRDEAFLATLIHFGSASSSSVRSPRVAEGHRKKAEMDGDTKAKSAFNWGETFKITEIEKLHRIHSRTAIESPSMHPTSLTLPSQYSESNFLEAKAKTIETTKLSVEETSEEQRLRAMREGSDVIRIRSEQQRSKETTCDANKVQTTLKSIRTDSLLKEIRVIFPSVQRIAGEHGLLSIDMVDGNSSPILVVSHSALANFDPAAFPLKGISEDEPLNSASWLEKLRELAEENSTTGSEPSVSLCLMVMARFHIAAVEAFAEVNQDDEQLTSETKGILSDDNSREEEQSSFEHYSTPPEEEEDGSEDNEDIPTLHMGDMLPSGRGNRMSRNSNADGSSVSSFNSESLHLQKIFVRFADQSGLDELRALLKRDVSLKELPFFAVEHLFGIDPDQIHKIDEYLGKKVSFAVSAAVRAGVLKGQRLNVSGKESIDRNPIDAGQERDSESVNLQDSQQSVSSGAKKRKKKKKKTKRKNSHAEAMPEEKGETPTATKPMNEQGKKDTPKEPASLPIAPNLEHPPGSKGTFQSSLSQTVTVPGANSFDTDQTEKSSMSAFHESVTSQSNREGSIITISSRDGVRATCVIVPASDNSDADMRSDKVSEVSPTKHAADDDEWETVEVKTRGRNRNKAFDCRGQSHNAGYNNQGNSGRKVKEKRTSQSRKRNAYRKIAREILFSILDSVEVEVQRRQKTVANQGEAESLEQKKRAVKSEATLTSLKSSHSSGKPLTMRDIVLGKHSNAEKKESESTTNNPVVYAGAVRSGRPSSESISTGGSTEVKTKGTQTTPPSLDQGTAPTFPETLSGASANTQSSLATEEVDNVFDKVGQANRGDIVLADDSSSSVDAEDEPGPGASKAAASSENDSSPPPPLPTLLGPGNANSATSSVASSLEAPHASSHRHHHSSSGNANDVGYHLLDVCDRLSRDMNVFMTRRAAALSARRLERGALLAALQETVSSIWGGPGVVEMYGSCATQLDLPSSDLDAVIIGLDAAHDSVMDLTRSPSAISLHPHQEPAADVEPPMSPPGTPSSVKQIRSPFPHSPAMMMNPYGMFSSSAERVMILAAELERQPWAVQVKPIPTASVPVVKILADPSKLPGIADSMSLDGEWMLQHHQVAAQAAAAVAAGISPPPPPVDQNGYFSSSATPQGPPPFPPHALPPWRGADVMNGLFKVDITFEGPEHGGIGSTQFSAEAVQDACNESGLPPESTPFVQVLMVLKELLAQRRLNEPFSGGLSSYALLLMVVAVVKERAIIREELERIERHRALVAAENAGIVPTEAIRPDDSTCQTDSTVSSGKADAPIAAPSQPAQPASKKGQILTSTPEEGKRPAKSKESKLQKGNKDATHIASEEQQSPKPTAYTGKSWASIAKKNVTALPAGKSSSAAQQPVQPTRLSTPKTQQKKQAPKAASFAQALSGKSVDPQAQKVAKSTTVTPSSQGASASSPSSKAKSEPSTDSQSQSEGRPVKMTHASSLARSPEQQQQQNGGLESTTFTGAPSLFPQGSNDVLEVLCSGETTAGKLLMHFLLFYGEHFDARTTAIDVIAGDSHHWTPYIPRRSGGSIDPVTGMLTVDPIVIYDPWEGGRGSNVARSCYAWSSIRWHFAQCYLTLSSAVERSGTPPTTPAAEATVKPAPSQVPPTDAEGMDMVSPLLELLVSF